MLKTQAEWIEYIRASDSYSTLEKAYRKFYLVRKEYSILDCEEIAAIVNLQYYILSVN